MYLDNVGRVLQKSFKLHDAMILFQFFTTFRPSCIPNPIRVTQQAVDPATLLDVSISFSIS